MPKLASPKSKFDPLEDGLLCEAVRMYGSSDWKLIASLIPGRNARQCRERWSNYTNPDLANGAWTDVDDATLLQKFGELGSQWQAIAGFFPGRARNAIRNRFRSLQRRARREAREGRIRAHWPTHAPGEVIAGACAAPRADPTAQDPFGFMDATVQNFTITWQSELDGDGASNYYFFQR
jgi:hypothetical protein